jgi:hypothetical protein
MLPSSGIQVPSHQLHACFMFDWVSTLKMEVIVSPKRLWKRILFPHGGRYECCHLLGYRFLAFSCILFHVRLSFNPEDIRDSSSETSVHIRTSRLYSSEVCNIERRKCLQQGPRFCLKELRKSEKTQYCLFLNWDLSRIKPWSLNREVRQGKFEQQQFRFEISWVLECMLTSPGKHAANSERYIRYLYMGTISSFTELSRTSFIGASNIFLSSSTPQEWKWKRSIDNDNLPVCCILVNNIF